MLLQDDFQGSQRIPVLSILIHSREFNAHICGQLAQLFVLYTQIVEYLAKAKLNRYVVTVDPAYQPAANASTRMMAVSMLIQLFTLTLADLVQALELIHTHLEQVVARVGH